MKRWPIIRHIRYFLLRREFAAWWDAVGQHLGFHPNEMDVQYLQDIWDGKR